MPYGDGTGPIGWHRGPCAGNPARWPAWRATRVRLSPEEEQGELARQERLLVEELTALRDRKQALNKEQ